MTTIYTYSVEPPVLSLVLQVVFALAPLVAITVVSVRIGRGSPWISVPWAAFALVWALQSFGQMSVVALAKPSLKVIGTIWANGAWAASSVALLIYLVVLAIAGPSKALLRELPA